MRRPETRLAQVFDCLALVSTKTANARSNENAVDEVSMRGPCRPVLALNSADFGFHHSGQIDHSEAS